MVSAVLIVAAAWAIRGQWTALSNVGDVVREGHWWLVAAGIGLPALNWLLSGGIFYILMRPRGWEMASRREVPLGEMMLLIGSAWLLNYLPLSPGLLGRVAYHRAVHRVPVTASVRVLVEVLVVGGVVIACLLALVVIVGRADTRVYAGLLGLPPLAHGAVFCALRGRSGAAPLVLAAALRWLDVLVWMARYFVVFALLQRPLTIPEAAAIAAASQAAMQVPLVGNGLGVREWAVGLVGPVLPSWMNAASGGLSRGLGLSADLLNRGLELVTALPVGMACTALVARRQGRA